MDDVDRRTVALAMQNRDRHGVTLDGMCLHCLPPGTRWPCLPYQLASAVIERLATHAPHPDWLEPS